MNFDLDTLISLAPLIIGTLALLIALYGAILSTYNIIIARRKERRKIKVILEYRGFDRTVRLIIVNTGHRPITISNFTISVYRGYWEGKYNYIGFPTHKTIGEVENPLPANIGDSESVVIPLSQHVVDALREYGLQATITVYDIEGNYYEEHTVRTINWEGDYDHESSGRSRDRAG